MPKLQNVIKDIFQADTTLTHTDSSATQKADGTFKLKAGQIQKLDSLHRETVAKLKTDKLHENWWETGKHVLYFVLVLLGQYLLFRLSSWLYKKAKARIELLKDHKLKPNLDPELRDTGHAKTGKAAGLSGKHPTLSVVVHLLVLTIPILFSIFPANQRACLQDCLLHLESG